MFVSNNTNNKEKKRKKKMRRELKLKVLGIGMLACKVKSNGFAYFPLSYSLPTFHFIFFCFLSTKLFKPFY